MWLEVELCSLHSCYRKCCQERAITKYRLLSLVRASDDGQVCLEREYFVCYEKVSVMKSF